MIRKVSLLFKRIDEKIIERLELFRQSSVYEELWDKMESLSNGQGKIFAQVVSVVIISLPLLIAFAFWRGNVGLKQSLEAKREIAQIIYNYKSKKAVAVPLKSSGTSQVSLKSKEDFLRIINMPSEEKKKMRIKTIKVKRVSKALGRSRVIMSFQNITTSSLMGAIKNLVYQHKARVSNIHIKRDKILKTLQGEVELIFYSATTSVEKK